MKTDLKLLEEDERLNINELALIEQAIRASQPTVQLSDLAPEESDRITRTKETGSTIAQLPHPHFNDRLNPNKVTAAPEISSRVSAVVNNVGIASSPAHLDSIFDLASTPADHHDEAENLESAIRARLSGETNQSVNEAAQHLEIARGLLEDQLPAAPDHLNHSLAEVIEQANPKEPFPDLAREIIHLGLDMEAFYTEKKLNRYKKEGDQFKANIDLLLKLNAQLPKMNSDDTPYEIKETTKVEIEKITEQLKAVGIDIFPGMAIGAEFSKEQLASATSQINHHIDVNRTGLQELFTTKISIAVQFLQMMTEVMKKVADLDDRQKRKALEIR